MLIPKKNGEENPSVDQLRPTRLLTSDYKILGLDDVIGKHQTYGVAGRTIGTNLHAMRIVCEAAEGLKYPLAVLQVDLSKEFDRVYRSSLFELLEACGIGARLLHLVQLCYRDVSTRLLVHGNRVNHSGSG